jgi:hypothetical protein
LLCPPACLRRSGDAVMRPPVLLNEGGAHPSPHLTPAVLNAVLPRCTALPYCLPAGSCWRALWPLRS